MNLSMKWLADYVPANTLSIKEFCSGMTLSGSKVEGWETEGEAIKKVVVGKLLSVTPHEDSDHLLICQVDTGNPEEPIQIVTGAQNVKAGDLVPVALDGAVLPPNADHPEGVKIKKGKLRGAESRGMLCSLGELGLTTHDFPYAVADGIFILQEDCAPGQDIQSAIGLNDTSVEFEITSNRPDCLSVLGLAREAHAAFQLPLTLPEPEYQDSGDGDDIGKYLSVTVENPQLCSRYAAAVVKNVKIGPSPRWMRERLRASGVRPINNYVDITNFVMLEYGHPMHAFDLRYVEDKTITVRNARGGETITTLDGAERSLSPEMLAVCDGKKPVAVAGVMGGEYSGIMEDTQTVVFEAACFDGASVRTTAKKLGMRTDASSRFEKGLPASGCMPALKRACMLVEMLGCGEVVPGILDRDSSDHTPEGVEFDAEWINRFLGSSITRGEMAECLSRLGFEIRGNLVFPPACRADIHCKADVAEEVARIHGYNNLPSTLFQGAARAKVYPERKFQKRIHRVMRAAGCSEITTFSFISPKYYDKIGLPEDSRLRSSVTIENPLGEDTSVMRTTILPSLCEVLARNYNNRNPEAWLYEIGSEYLPDLSQPDKLPAEPSRLAVGLYGGNADFYTLKGIVETLLQECGLEGCEWSVTDASCPFEEKAAFHPGRSACLRLGDTPIGIVGELHPDVLERYGIGTRAFAAKLNLPEMFSEAKLEKSYRPLPKYPAAARDLSLVCDEGIPAARLEKEIREAVGKILEKVTLFDVYQGEQIPKGKKSISYSISMRSHEGTLTDGQADQAMRRVLDALEKLGAEIRQ